MYSLVQLSVREVQHNSALLYKKWELLSNVVRLEAAAPIRRK